MYNITLMLSIIAIMKNKTNAVDILNTTSKLHFYSINGLKIDCVFYLWFLILNKVNIIFWTRHVIINYFN